MALVFESTRLNVFEVTGRIASPLHCALLERIPQILTSTVVENLPPYFHQVDSQVSAGVWLERMLSDSRLLLVTTVEDELIGFLFVFVDNDKAHIGYLLAEAYWGKGLASELLQGFIDAVATTESWVKLIGGVDRSNIASIHLLKKLGFVESEGDSHVVFFEYRMT